MSASAAPAFAASDLAVVVVIDRSASMQGPKIEAAREATRAIRRVLPATASFAVLAFDKKVETVVALGPPAATADRAIAAIAARGGTDLAPALARARALLADHRASRKLIVLVTDADSLDDPVGPLVTGARIPIITAAFAERGSNVTDRLSRTGGKTYLLSGVEPLRPLLVGDVRSALAH